jgi:ABC-type polysaccharide/polyol phosphate transport system ATPase subunit
MSTLPPAVLVDGVDKTFKLPREHIHTLKERALHPFHRPGHDLLGALRDVSFAVEQGEFFGIVGRNGSGKSTLLKCMAGIYRADAGRIYVNGRVSTFIELGVGFNPDLAAYDNVILNATMLGLSTREARRRYDAIIDFAELHDFVDLKLKNYSSGMLVRLAFAVMIQVDADILLIDEVLAVGDAAFQQKCFDEFARIRRSGATVLLVTHDLGAVQRFCDRAVLLERGRLVEIGDPQFVGDRYLELNFSLEAREQERAAGAEAPTEAEAAEAQPSEPEPVRLSDGSANIVEAWFEDESGHRADVLQTRQPCAFKARVRFSARLEDPAFGFTMYSSQDDQIFGADNVLLGPSGTFEPGDEVVFAIRFENLLAPDRYWVTPAVAPSTGGLRWHDRRVRFLSVMVTGSRRASGMLEIPFSFGIDRTVGSPHDEQEVAR